MPATFDEDTELDPKIVLKFGISKSEREVLERKAKDKKKQAKKWKPVH